MLRVMRGDWSHASAMGCDAFGRDDRALGGDDGRAGGVRLCQPMIEANWQQGRGRAAELLGAAFHRAGWAAGSRTRKRRAACGLCSISIRRAWSNSDPNAHVTTGLLTVELKSGNVQLGDGTFEQRSPGADQHRGRSRHDGPTYADLSTFDRILRPERRRTPYSAYIFDDDHQFTLLTNDECQAVRGAVRCAIRRYLHLCRGPVQPLWAVRLYALPVDFIKRLTDAGIPNDQTPGYPISPVIDRAGADRWEADDRLHPGFRAARADL